MQILAFRQFLNGFSSYKHPRAKIFTVLESPQPDLPDEIKKYKKNSWKGPPFGFRFKKIYGTLQFFSN